MLDGKRNADDRNRTRKRGHDVTDSQPKTRKNEPKYIADKPPRSGSDILFLMERFTADRLFAGLRV
ncbi:hypothetical protein SDC9_202141 [bioreactor metagenome]|uniref:Uncharacterized protein n=1 Tax=bioreactor metagenome TaxID=1076179 RepID=A0A645ISW1_9ZZZZ